MEQEVIVLGIAIFGASALQASTGIGFGVIAGAVLLIVLNDGAAIQISVLLNLLIAMLLAPSLRQKADRPDRDSSYQKSDAFSLIVARPGCRHTDNICCTFVFGRTKRCCEQSLVELKGRTIK